MPFPTHPLAPFGLGDCFWTTVSSCVWNSSLTSFLLPTTITLLHVGCVLCSSWTLDAHSPMFKFSEIHFSYRVTTLKQHGAPSRLLMSVLIIFSGFSTWHHTLSGLLMPSTQDFNFFFCAFYVMHVLPYTWWVLPSLKHLFSSNPFALITSIAKVKTI